MRNQNIHLCPMTPSLAQHFFRDFRYDPAVFEDGQSIPEFRYDESWVDQYFNKQVVQKRIHLAILHGEQPVGEVILKNLHQPKGSCTLSIHLQNDSVKNRSFGTQAEILALEYAFQILGLNTVFADALRKNTRSQHMLQRVGFVKICEDESFVYYSCDAKGR